MRSSCALVVGCAWAVAASAVAGPAPKGLSASDWTSIREAHEASAYAVRSVDRGFVAWNPRQRLRFRFDEAGFRVRPERGAWDWGLALRGFGWAGRERDVDGSAPGWAEGADVSFERRPGLVEWYRNGPDGLEHGFTVTAPPSGEGEVLSFRLTVRGDLTAEVEDDDRSLRLAAGADGALLRYAGLAAWDASGRELPARLGVSGRSVSLFVEAAGAHYPVTVDPVLASTYLKASNAGSFDAFGGSVAVSGDTVVVGAPYEDSAATGVNGNGSDDSASDSGAAYVFVRDPQTGLWSEQAYLKAPNGEAQDNFGWSVAVFGDTIVVGAPHEDGGVGGVNGNPSDNSASGSGAAYVFVRDPLTGTWSPQAYLKAPNPEHLDVFGERVAIHGDTVVVGARGEDSAATGVNGNGSDNGATDSGAAYVYVRDPQTGTWSLQAYLKASNTEAGDDFGEAVAVHGDTIVVGAPFEDSGATGVNGNQADNGATDSGAAYVYVRDPQAGTWSPQAYLKAPNPDGGDWFGVSVSVLGDTLVVGASSEDSAATGVNGNGTDNGAPDAGAAYVYVRDPQAGTWSPQAYLKAPNAEAGDLFGTSVSLAADTLVVGAPFEDSAATGVNGNQADNSAADSGAAYVYVRDPQNGAWSPQTYLKASNTGAGDLFGGAVAAAGDTFLVGAYTEDGANDGVPDAGAAYVFGLAPIDTFGTGCAGLVIGFHNLPRIGSTDFQVTLTGASPALPANLIVGVSDSLWAGVPLPLDLGPFGAPGCTLLTGLNLVLPSGTDFVGEAALTLPIPKSPVLPGLPVFFQWEVVDATQNALGLVFSDGLSVVLLQP